MLVEGISLHDPFSLCFGMAIEPIKTVFSHYPFRLFTPIFNFFSGVSAMIGLICLKIVSNFYRPYLITYC